MRVDYRPGRVYVGGGLAYAQVPGGYCTVSADTLSAHMTVSDYRGDVRSVIAEDGRVEERNDYYPYGMAFYSTAASVQPWKHSGKEHESRLGIHWLDFGARRLDFAKGQWTTMDPLCEKTPWQSPYAYCGADPVNKIDPDGRDWYSTEDGTLIWNPKVHSQDDIGNKDANRGYKYVGETYYDKETNTSYRKDGTVLFSNEELAYQRMWYLADVHWRSKKYPCGKEEMAYLLSDGKVLIMADNWNVSDKSYSKGYHRENGVLYSQGGESFAYIGQVHTHQMGGDKGLSHSSYQIDDDNFAAADPDRPVFVMHKNGNIYAGVFSTRKKGFDNFGNQPIGSISHLFDGSTSLVDCARIIRSKF